MKRKTIRVCFAALVAAVLILVQQNWDSIADRDQDPAQSLRLGTNIWTGYEPLYLARSLDYYDESSVRLVECTSASQVIRAFRNNTLEVAALTLDEALLLKESGYDVRIILVTDISHGGDVILGNSEVQQLADLRGRKVGVEHTALGAYVLTRALDGVGMSVADVNIVPLEVDEHERAFTDGIVDAVVTFDPVSSHLIAQGATRLFDSTQIPGEIVDVLVVRSRTLETSADQLDILLRGWFSAQQYLKEHPQEASRRMAGRLQLEPQDVLKSFDGLRLPDRNENLLLLGGTQPTLVETAERLVDVMLDQKLLYKEIDVSQLFSGQPLEQLPPEPLIDE